MYIYLLALWLKLHCCRPSQTRKSWKASRNCWKQQTLHCLRPSSSCANRMITSLWERDASIFPRKHSTPWKKRANYIQSCHPWKNPKSKWRRCRAKAGIQVFIPTMYSYINEADNTGAFYSPLQRYLWDVRKEIEKLIEWVDSQDSVLLDEERKHTLALGAKVDEWNLERRRLVKEVILNA